MRVRRLLAWILSAMIASNTVLPAFATETSIAIESVVDETAEEKIEIGQGEECTENSQKTELHFDENFEIMNEVGIIDSGFIPNDKGGISWLINNDYELFVEGKGDIWPCDEENSWEKYAENITYAEIKLSDVKGIGGMFCGYRNLTSVNLSELDTSQEISMHLMFSECESLVELDLSGLDTSNVTDMSYMFEGCVNLTKLDLSGLDTSNVLDMSYMFEDCTNLTELNLTGLDTSNVTKMNGMFSQCSSLTELDLTCLDTSQVTDMSWMFWGCENLIELDLASLDTSNVTDMSYMFSGCGNLIELDLTGLDTSNVTDMSGMFSECENLIELDLAGLDTSNVTKMNGMFSGCSSLTELDLTCLDTSQVTDMSWMFSGCENLIELDLAGLDTSQVTDMSGMFWGCENLIELDLAGLDTSQVTDMSGMFSECENLIELDLAGLDTSNVTEMNEMFSWCSSLTDLDLSVFDTRNVTNMSSMFKGCKSLAELDLSGLDASQVTNIQGIFYDCNCLQRIAVPIGIPIDLDIKLDGVWYSSDGTKWEKLPQGLKKSIVIQKNSIPSDLENDDTEDDDGYEVSFKYKDYKEKPLKTRFSNHYFSESSYVYNHELARLSLYLECTSFTVNEKKHYGIEADDNGEIAKERYSNIADAFEQMKFDEVNYYNYGKSLNSPTDEVAYTIAKKENVEGSTLLAVVVRGGGYGAEWSSNMNVGMGYAGYHLGFNDASLDIYMNLTQKIEKLDGPIKVWITGYSRGAAVANLLAAKINNYAEKTDKLKPDDVFAYTFATPAGVSETYFDNPNSVLFGNIFNIVYLSDIVPRVAPEQWGFTRYGTTLYFDKDATDDVYDNVTGTLERYMKNDKDKVIDVKNFADYELTTYALTKIVTDLFPTTESSIYMQGALKDILMYFNTMTMGANGEWKKIDADDIYTLMCRKYGDEYKKAYKNVKTLISLDVDHDWNVFVHGVLSEHKETMFNVLAICSMHGVNYWQAKVFVRALLLDAIGTYLGTELLSIFESDADMKIGLDILVGHEPYMYLSWMSQPEEDTFGYCPSEIKREEPSVQYTNVTVSCPVNTYVYDQYNNLVVEVVNHEVKKADIPAYVIGETTNLFFKAREQDNYRIEVEATDNGTMNYTVTETDMDMNPGRRINYYDIPVEKEQLFSMQLQGLQEDNDTVYQLTYIEDELEKIVEPAEDLETVYFAKVITEATKGGTVSGDGEYIVGSTVHLYATPQEGYIFEGWYENDVLLSCEENLNILANEDKMITAVFVEETGSYDIYYYDEQEEMLLEPGKYISGEEILLPIPEKEGYRFVGWLRSNDTGEIYLSKIPNDVSGELHLYAVWAEITEYEEYAVENIKNQVYLGTAITPKPRVYDENELLTLGKDYTLTYKNNTKVGTAQVIVKGKGNYTKTMTIEFEIIPKLLADEDILITCADKLYNGKKQVSAPVVKWDKKTLKSGTDYTVTYSDNQISAGIVTVIIEGKGNYSGTVQTSYRITEKDISKALMDKIATQYYTGTEIEPEIILYADKSAKAAGEKLVLDTDYSLIYENNVNAGKGTVTIVGLGEYGGSKKVTFSISKRNAASYDLDVKEAATGNTIAEYAATYNGSVQKPELVITDNGKLLEEGKDYKLAFSNTTNAATVDSKTKPTITITGLGNYTGSKKVFFNILPQDISAADGLNIKVDDAKYTGKAVKPKVTVTYAGKNLKSGTDYKVTYVNNVERGENTAYVTIEGLKNFTGTADVTFRIYGQAVSGFVVDKIAPVVYTPHEAIEPEVFVYASKAMQKEGNRLTEGVDYEITSYEANEKAGTGKVTITGLGEYGGSKTVTFTISKRNLLTEGIFVEVIDQQMTYTGSALKPVFKVWDGDVELIEGVDYTVSYSNNKAVPKNVKTEPMLIIKGKGNYTGTNRATFEILPKSLTADDIVITSKDVLFNQKTANSAKGMTTTVTVMDGSKKLRTADYKIVEYKDNHAAGTATMVITGNGNYSGTGEVTFRIYQNNISKVTVAKIPSELYTGKAIEPKPVVTLKVSKTETITLVEGEDYTITYDKNMKIGTAKAIITGIGEYGGSKSVNFTILPKWLKWFV